MKAKEVLKLLKVTRQTLCKYVKIGKIRANDIKEKSDNEEKEIFSDIISLLHCFAMKMYSKRRKNKLKLIEENLEIEQ